MAAEAKGRSMSLTGMKATGLVQFDQVLLFAVFALCAIGMVAVYSASSFTALTKHGDAFYFMKRQLVAGAMGVACMVAILRMNYMVLRKWAYPLLGVVIFLLILVLFIGTEANGAKRWIRLPGFSLQPSEMAKVSVAIYLACSLAKKRDKIRSFSVGVLPHCFLTGIVALLVFIQKDLGSTVALGVILIFLILAAGAPLQHVFGIVAAVIPFGIYKVVSEPYRMNRIRAFMDPWKYRQEEAYQVTESMMAIGSGGVTGVGLGQGRHKLDYLPEIHTDFIFSLIGEEAGLIGTLLVIALFAIIIWRGIRIAFNAQDAFGTYLALGITAYLAFQSLGNMAVAMGVVPTKGMTLPFVSYGGTSLVMNLLAVGILLSISEGRGGFLKPKSGSTR